MPSWNVWWIVGNVILTITVVVFDKYGPDDAVFGYVLWIVVISAWLIWLVLSPPVVSRIRRISWNPRLIGGSGQSKAGTVPNYHTDRVALGNLLISFHRRAVTHILLKPPKERSEMPGWRALEAQWQREVGSVMRTAGCPLFDINEFEVIEMYPLQVRHGDPEIASDLSMLAFRLERLKALAKKYAAEN